MTCGPGLTSYDKNVYFNSMGNIGKILAAFLKINFSAHVRFTAKLNGK